MNQIRLFITTTEAGAARFLEDAAPAFEEEGYALSTSEIDEAGDVWEASVYLDAGMETAVRDALSSLTDGEIRREDLPDIDWVARSLEGLRPVRAGRFVLHGSHDRAAVRPGDLAIEIDAGQAFGTGHHGTTAGCLEMIEAILRRGRAKHALDLGTGSGVLAIGIHKLAPATRILATDIDPIATRVARTNIAANGVSGAIAVRTATGFDNAAFARYGPFDLIVANILARPLMAMAPDIRKNLAPGGSLVLSGILADQRWKVLAAFNGQHLAHRRTLWRDGWVTLLLQ